MEGQLHFLFLVANSVIHYRNLALPHFVKSQKQKPIISFQRHIQSNLSIKQVWALPEQSAESHRGTVCWDRLVLSQEKQSTNPPVSLPHRKAPGLMLPLLLTYISNPCSAPKQQNQSPGWCKEPTNWKASFIKPGNTPYKLFVQMAIAKTVLPVDRSKQRARQEKSTVKQYTRSQGQKSM